MGKNKWRMGTKTQTNLVKMPPVALVIPTIDRPDFLMRLLSYYCENFSNLPFTIYVGDASKKSNNKYLLDNIKEFRKKLKIKYTKFPPDSLFRTLKRTLKK